MDKVTVAHVECEGEAFELRGYDAYEIFEGVAQFIWLEKETLTIPLHRVKSISEVVEDAQ